jgi:hypothetical protein
LFCFLFVFFLLTQLKILDFYLFDAYPFENQICFMHTRCLMNWCYFFVGDSVLNYELCYDVLFLLLYMLWCFLVRTCWIGFQLFYSYEMNFIEIY